LNEFRVKCHVALNVLFAVSAGRLNIANRERKQNARGPFGAHKQGVIVSGFFQSIA
jgi:hypothetical protein